MINKSWFGWRWQLMLASWMVLVGVGRGDRTLAQIIPDATLGAENSVVTPTNINGIPSDRIDGGAIRDKNLFHSFEQFNIDAGRGAYFINPSGIENILSRVTGNDPSNILGTLGVVGGDANLFLMNPNGIIFGPNASLDLNGSFLGTTAGSINFANSIQFSATAPQTIPLLKISIPLGLQFEENAGQILVQGSGAIRTSGAVNQLLNRDAGLQVQPSKTLALVGNGIALEGGILTTDDGRIELGSVTRVAQLSLTPIEKGYALGYESVPAFADVSLSNAAAVNASGEGGGDIQVRGRQVTLTDGSAIEVATLGSQPGGTLTVAASEAVKVIGTTADGRVSSFLTTSVYPGATGNGGNLTIETGQLIVRDGAQISAGTFGQGSAGSLTVKAAESVELSGTAANGRFASSLGTSSERGATGNGGNLTIETGQLIVRDGAQVVASTFGQGAAGTLTVKAAESVELSGTAANGRFPSGLFSSAQAEATGGGGNLTIETGQLIVRDGAIVFASTLGQGSAGTLTVKATESVELSGTTANGQSPSGLATSVYPGATGGGGNLTIETAQLIVRDGAQ
uniref:filamentous hemagglutinin N-terminal domain-containing protein n=1 Tax=Gloeocapsopsis crepidinum TaxID=693223 RepID=UPI003F6ECAF2